MARLKNGIWSPEKNVWTINDYWILALAVSSDGRLLLSGSQYGAIKLWDATTGQFIRDFKGHTYDISAVAFSPDGVYAVSASADHMLKVWDVSKGKSLKTFKDRDHIKDVIFTANGKFELSSEQHKGSYSDARFYWETDKENNIKVFTSADRKLTQIFGTLADEVHSMALSADGEYILTGNGSNTLTLWDIKKSRPVRVFKGHSGKVMAAAFSPDSRFCLSGSRDSTVRLWDVTTGQLIRLLGKHRHDVRAVSFSSDGRFAISGGLDSVINFWDIGKGSLSRTLQSNDGIQNLAVSANGKYIVSNGYPPTIWNTGDGVRVDKFKCNSIKSRTASFSQDGRFVFAEDVNKTIYQLDAETGAEIQRFEKGHTISVINALAVSPDGKYLLSGGEGRFVNLWETATGRLIRKFSGNYDDATSVQFTRDGLYAVYAGYDGTVRFWDVQTGAEVITLLNFKDGKNWLVITPDGRFDGTAAAIQQIHYVQGLTVIPVESFYDKFYTPNLMARVLGVLAADHPGVDLRTGFALPPLIRIISPKMNESFTQEQIDVMVEVTDQGGGLEDIRLYQNGKIIPEDTRGMKPVRTSGATMTKTFTVSLLPGRNTFTATAFNRERTEAVPQEVTVEMKAAQATANLYLFAIGINQYQNSKYNLRYGKSDAEAVVRTLETRGKGIFGTIIKREIYDGEATKSAILKQLQDLTEIIRSQDVFVFYYAGHGTMSEGTDKETGMFYLALTDVTQLYGNDEMLKSRGISAVEMKDLCSRIKAQKQAVIIDACQSGVAVEAFALRGASEEKAILQLARSAGVVVLASTGSEQYASEFKDLNHGVFTYALLKAIDGEADGSPKDGKITVKELEAYINDQVPVLTKQYRGSAQYPNCYSRGQDFPIGIKP